MLWSALSILALGCALAAASETTFSVNDDLFAFPQVRQLITCLLEPTDTHSMTLHTQTNISSWTMPSIC